LSDYLKLVRIQCQPTETIGKASRRFLYAKQKQTTRHCEIFVWLMPLTRDITYWASLPFHPLHKFVCHSVYHGNLILATKANNETQMLSILTQAYFNILLHSTVITKFFDIKFLANYKWGLIVAERPSGQCSAPLFHLQL